MQFVWLPMIGQKLSQKLAMYSRTRTYNKTTAIPFLELTWPWQNVFADSHKGQSHGSCQKSPASIPYAGQVKWQQRGADTAPVQRAGSQLESEPSLHVDSIARDLSTWTCPDPAKCQRECRPPSDQQPHRSTPWPKPARGNQGHYWHRKKPLPQQHPELKLHKQILGDTCYISAWYRSWHTEGLEQEGLQFRNLDKPPLWTLLSSRPGTN